MTIPKRNTANLIKYFCRQYPKQSLLVVFFLLLSGVAETIGIGALLPLITIIVEGQQTPNNILADAIFKLYGVFKINPVLHNLLITIVFAIGAKAAIVFMAMRYVSYVSADVTRDFRLRLIKALMNARWDYFTGLSIGKISNTISAEASRAGSSYMQAGRMLAALIQTIIYIGVAFLVSWKVSLVAFGMGIFMAVLLRGFIRMARRAGEAMTDRSNNMIAQLNESLSGIKPLKAMGQEKHYINNLDTYTAQVMQAQKKQSLASLLMQIVYEPLAVILLACGLYYVLTFTQTEVESVILLAFLFYRLMTHANLLQTFYQNMVLNEPAVWGLQTEIENAQKAKETLANGDTPTFEKGIEFKNLSVQYDKNAPIFENFNANIPVNKITAVYGPSGVGKTTLVDSLLKLINVNDGQIYFDGKPTVDIHTKVLRQMIGYVPQETFLFHDSIFNNIVLENSELTENDAKKALEKVDALDFVEKFEDGIHTVVGERGGKLSGGQRQRIALARAIIRDPKLLILDESTSGLDAETEEKVLATLQRISQDITIIVISHNPKILDIADNVINLERQNA